MVHRHRDVQGGTARAAVFGVSDGLVSNVALILGIAGAGTDPSFVRLAGISGLLAGAISMAAGEFVSLKAQAELVERELEIERISIAENPEAEEAELAVMHPEFWERTSAFHPLRRAFVYHTCPTHTPARLRHYTTPKEPHA